MADELEAMGFPSEWCERALRSTSGIEPAVELLLQWQADGGAPAAPTLRLDAKASSSIEASSMTTSGSGSPDAVVPDAYADERKRRADAALRIKQEREAEKAKVRQHMQEDKANRRWRDQLVATPAAVPRSQAGSGKIENFVELQIHCPGYPTPMKTTFNADATLKDVREFVFQQLQCEQPSQATTSLSSGASRRSGRHIPFSGVSAAVSSDREAQRAVLQAARDNYDTQTNRIFAEAKSMRNFQPSSASPVLSSNQARGSICFIIPFPRTVYDSEASMETTLREASLVPRGNINVQFRPNQDASSSEQVHKPSEPTSCDVRDGVLLEPVSMQPIVAAVINRTDQHEGDLEMREQRLKATVDRISQRRHSKSLESRTTAAPTVLAGPIREERSLEVDGERVRNRELALQAAAKRMTEACQIFREGLPPDEGESGGDFHSPFDSPTGDVPVGNGVSMTERSNLPLSRVAICNARNKDAKGKQPADCGPSTRQSQPAEVHVQDIGSQIAGPAVRTTRARIPLSSPLLSRPEKQQRTLEATSNSPVEVSDQAYPARGHAIDLAGRRAEVPEGSSSEMEQECPSSSASPLLSELRVRLEDGHVVRHSFPANTTLEAVCESMIPEGAQTSDYGLIIPIPGSHFMEGQALNSTLLEVGLVPRGTVHLQKVANRGLVTRGRRRAPHRGMRDVQDHNDPNSELEQLWQEFSRHMNPNLTYEELVELEDSIGRVNVGLPEATIANLPTHVVERSDGEICIVCLAEMVEGEEVLALPCVHTFHPACIKQWLLQSTSCPTCKHCLA